MPRNLTFSVRALGAIIATCCVMCWLAKSWLFPNRIAGQSVALIGPMDIDHDGRDDRVRLTWMIVRNGGKIDFDMPASGPSQGAIRPQTTWYVYDRDLVSETRLPAPFLKAYPAVIKQARRAGIRPISLEKLVALLNGTMGFDLERNLWVCPVRPRE